MKYLNSNVFIELENTFTFLNGEFPKQSRPLSPSMPFATEQSANYFQLSLKQKVKRPGSFQQLLESSVETVAASYGFTF